MISYESALSIIRELGLKAQLREEIVPTVAARRRIFSRDVFGGDDVPTFDNSAMDGFAVRAHDTRGASAECPVALPVRGCLAAGEAPIAGVDEGFPCAIEIMTGAPMPGRVFDAVVRVEDVERRGDEIILRNAVKAGANVRKRGSDFRAGQRVVRKGMGVTPAHIMALASLGIDQVPVYVRPKVAILSTGRELRDLGELRDAGAQIWNSSGPYLENWLAELPCEGKNMGTVGDCAEEFRTLVRQALDWGAEVILSTGAVSMGKHDFVVDALRELGATLLFHKVAIRPGKPICFGEFREGPVFFGLPGNPVSTAVGARFFVEPYLRALLRLPRDQGLPARLLTGAGKPPGMRCFYKARVQFGPDKIGVEILPDQGSYVVSSLIEANCWAVLEEAGSACEPGDVIKVFSLNDVWRFANE